MTASPQPGSPRCSGLAYLRPEISRPVWGSDATGGKNMTLVLGTGCVTQAAWVISCARRRERQMRTQVLTLAAPLCDLERLLCLCTRL